MGKGTASSRRSPSPFRPDTVATSSPRTPIPAATSTANANNGNSNGRPPPPATHVSDGVGVVVRVRPLTTVERADPSLRNCVQCLKDYVVIGGAISNNANTNSSFTSGGITNAAASTAAAALSPGGARTTSSRRSSSTSNNAKTAAAQTPSSLPSPASTAAPARAQQFQVDQVFHPHSAQLEVYDQCCRRIVEGLFDGINGSVLAYGATGSGKTHTMFGGAMSAAGIVYQAVQDIFEEKSRLEEEEEKAVTIKCSFLEIYNEEVFDLLPTGGGGGGGGGVSNANSSNHTNSGSTGGNYSSPDKSRRRARVPLQVREAAKEDAGKHPNPEYLNVCGLSYAFPQSVDDFARLIEVGHTNRFVAATGANAQSSRSHAIITVEVVVAAAGGAEGTVARVRFCDLAGSERAAASSNSGLRLREGGSINRSLLALGAVVQSLVQRKRHPGRQVFVPYRGSKLTRLLRDGIGGNCRTQMILCLSPTSRQYEESVNTMLFAMQAKEIRVSARRNAYSINSAALARNQEEVIGELRAELAAARDELMRLGVPLQANNSLVTRTAGGSINGNDDSGGTNTDTIITTVTAPAPDRLQALTSSGSLASMGTIGALSATGGGGDTTNTNANANSRPPSPQPSTAVVDVATPNTTSTASRGTVSRAVRPSVFQEGTRMFTELETRLKAFTAEKEALYYEMRDAEERQGDQDIRLREHKWRLAQFLGSSAMNNRVRGIKARLAAAAAAAGGELTSGGTVVTPVGVAGLRQLIAALEADNRTQDEAISALTEKLDAVDRRIAGTRQDLLRDRQHATLELLLDNAKLRQNCTEAECLAAHYHQRLLASLNREREYEQAVQSCVGAIRAAMPMLPFVAPQHGQAKLALLFAGLPTAATQNMIDVFESSLRVEATPPLAPQLPPMVPSGHAPNTTSGGYAGGGGGGSAVDRYDNDAAVLSPHTTTTPHTAPPVVLGTATTTSGGGGSLEQQYLDLVETATSLRTHSPTHGRGQRGASVHTTTSSKTDEEWEAQLAAMQSDLHGGDTTAAAATDATGSASQTETITVRSSGSGGTEASTAATTAGGGSKRVRPPPGASSAKGTAAAGSVSVRGGGGGVRRLSPYARTFSTSSFAGKNRVKPQTDPEGSKVYGRTHSTPVVRSSYNTNSTNTNTPINANSGPLSISSLGGGGRRRPGRQLDSGGGTGTGLGSRSNRSSSSNNSSSKSSTIHANEFRRARTDTAALQARGSASSSPPAPRGRVPSGQSPVHPQPTRTKPASAAASSATASVTAAAATGAQRGRSRPGAPRALLQKKPSTSPKPALPAAATRKVKSSSSGPSAATGVVPSGRARAAIPQQQHQQQASPPPLPPTPPGSWNHKPQFSVRSNTAAVLRATIATTGGVAAITAGVTTGEKFQRSTSSCPLDGPGSPKTQGPSSPLSRRNKKQRRKPNRPPLEGELVRVGSGSGGVGRAHSSNGGGNNSRRTSGLATESTSRSYVSVSTTGSFATSSDDDEENEERVRLHPHCNDDDGDSNGGGASAQIDAAAGSGGGAGALSLGHHYHNHHFAAAHSGAVNAEEQESHGGSAAATAARLSDKENNSNTGGAAGGDMVTLSRAAVAAHISRAPSLAAATPPPLVFASSPGATATATTTTTTTTTAAAAAGCHLMAAACPNSGGTSPQRPPAPLRKNSAHSTSTTVSCEDELLVSRSTCADGYGGE